MWGRSSVSSVAPPNPVSDLLYSAVQGSEPVELIQYPDWPLSVARFSNVEHWEFRGKEEMEVQVLPPQSPLFRVTPIFLNRRSTLA